MPGDKTNKIVRRFAGGVSAYQRARAHVNRGEFDEYEQALTMAAREATGALEWTLKAHLRYHERRATMDKADADKLKQPTFDVLVRLMKQYADPPLDNERASRFFEYRDIRNEAEHDGVIPSLRTVEEILSGTRDAIRELLRVEETALPIVRDQSEAVPGLDNEDMHPFLRRMRKISGRESELALMKKDLIDALETKTGRLILIRGKSGTGKTFVAQEACRIAHELGYDLATTACEPFHEGMALFPIREFIRQLCRSSSLAAAVEEHFALTSSQVSIARLAEEPGVDPVQRREAFLATFANALYGRFSGREKKNARPILLFLDDLEWIEAGTADAILCLRSRFGQGPLVVLGAYRTDLVPRTTLEHHPLNPIINIAKRYREHTLIVDVATLPRSQIGSAVEAILGGACEFPPSFYDRLYRETEGNPLFLREVLRTLMGNAKGSDSAAVRQVDDVWRLVRNVDHWDIPATIEEAITARLDQLDESQRSELEKAAVIGRHFAYLVILKLGTDSEDVVSDCLERLINIEVIQELDEEELSFEFTHGKIRDVIYDAIPKFKRLRLHKSIAEVLKLLNDGKRRNWDALIGNHLFHANLFEDAFGYLLNAARTSMSEFAVTQAAEQYERVLAAGYRAHFPHDEDEAAIKLEYARALRLSGVYGKAIDVLKQVLVEVEAGRMKGKALNHLGDLYWLTGKMDQALETYLECEKIVRQGGYYDLLLETVADLCEFYDREAERLAASDANLAANHRIESDGFLEEQIRLATTVGDKSAQSRAHRNAAKRYRRQGRLDDAIRSYQLALTQQNVADHKISISYAKTLRFVGRRDEAWDLIERVLDWGVQSGARRTEAIARQYKGLMLMEETEPEQTAQAVEELRAALAIHDELGYDRGIREAHLLLGELHAQRGEWAYARACLQKATGTRATDTLRLCLNAAAQLKAMGEPARAARLKSLAHGAESLDGSA
jgi:tetratricopeptide (TPR) repeat protein